MSSPAAICASCENTWSGYICPKCECWASNTDIHSHNCAWFIQSENEEVRLLRDIKAKLLTREEWEALGREAAFYITMSFQIKKGQGETVKLKIVSDGTAHGTQLINAGTGEEIRDVISIDWHIDAKTRVATARAEFINVAIDAVGKMDDPRCVYPKEVAMDIKFNAQGHNVDQFYLENGE